jgi:hypothetical protein
LTSITNPLEGKGKSNRPPKLTIIQAKASLRTMFQYLQDKAALVVNKVRIASQFTPTALRKVSHAAKAAAQNLRILSYGIRNLPYQKLCLQLGRLTIDHPYHTAFTLFSVATLIAPGLVISPLLGLLGFTSSGVAAGRFGFISYQ